MSISNKHLEDTEQVARILAEEQRDLKRAGRGVFNRASRTGSCGRKGSGVVMPGDRAGKGYKKGGVVQSVNVDSILEMLNGSSTLKEMLNERLEKEHQTYQMAIGRAVDDVFSAAREAIMEVADVMVEQQAYISSLQGRVFALEKNLEGFVSAVSRVINLGEYQLKFPSEYEEVPEPVEVEVAVATNQVGQTVVECVDVPVCVLDVNVNDFVQQPTSRGKRTKNEKSKDRAAGVGRKSGYHISKYKNATKEELYQVTLDYEKELGCLPSISALARHDSIFKTRIYSSQEGCRYWRDSGDFLVQYAEWKSKLN